MFFREVEYARKLMVGLSKNSDSGWRRCTEREGNGTAHQTVCEK